MTITSSSSSPLAVECSSLGTGLDDFRLAVYLLAHRFIRLVEGSPHTASKCSWVICDASVASVPTQPHAEKSFPASLSRFSFSPVGNPRDSGDALRFRFGGMSGRGKRKPDASCTVAGQWSSQCHEGALWPRDPRTRPACFMPPLARLRQRLRGLFSTADNAARILRRRTLTSKIYDRLPRWKSVSGQGGSTLVRCRELRPTGGWHYSSQATCGCSSCLRRS